MSSDVAVRVAGVSKRYELYGSPRDRLKQFILPHVRRAAGRARVDYFREFWALRDVSFEARKGEPIGIVGRNGSGKSTLLQIITGTLAPTQGTVQTQGRIAALLELGSGFNPEFSGRENVYLNAALLGFTRAQIDQRFDAIVGFADIGAHLEQPVKTYSSGMLVRLAFAVQVQVEPDILIVDEALAVGDALFQKRCLQRIAKLVSDGTTLLFVSHDQENVRTLTSRCLLLDRGAPAAWGPSPDVLLEYRRRLNEEEAAFFAAAVQDVAARARESAAKKIDATPAAAVAEAAIVPTPDEVKSPAAAREGPRLVGLDEPAPAPPPPLPPIDPDVAHRSFGDESVTVVSVETLDAEGKPCTVYFTGGALRVRITCQSQVTTDRLNVGMRIRNKEGVKIYSWGTLNQDMAVRAAGGNEPLFWSRPVRAGDTFSVDFRCACDLGVNLYEVQAAVSFEETPDYMGQRILHWVDEAAFFQVLMRKEEHFFGGVVDLRMQAAW